MIVTPYIATLMLNVFIDAVHFFTSVLSVIDQHPKERKNLLNIIMLQNLIESHYDVNTP